MTGLYSTGLETVSAERLGIQLRRLRDVADVAGWKPASAAGMDATKLSKIENGKLLPTQSQLAALAGFYKVDLAPLERRRLAEEMLKRYGSHPEFDAATAIVREEGGEYLVKKKQTAVSKPAKPVNKRGKSK